MGESEIRQMGIVEGWEHCTLHEAWQFTGLLGQVQMGTIKCSLYWSQHPGYQEKKLYVLPVMIFITRLVSYRYSNAT